MAGSVIQKHDDTRLPKDWEVITLGEILPLTYGSGLTESNRDASGNVPVYGSNGIVGRHSSAITSGPCLIVGRKGAAGAVHYSCEPCWVIDTTYFAEGTPCTDLRFFYYVLSSANLRELDRSTAVPSLSRNDYNAVAVPLPPLGEQRRIAARLDELLSGLDAAVAALERVRGNLQRYRASVLKAAVEGRLTEEWRAQRSDTEPATVSLDRILRERRRRWEEEQLAKYAAKGQKPPANWQSKYKPPATPDTTELPALPEGWCWTTLGECFEVHVGATPSRARADYWGGDISWVSSGEVQFCRIRETRESITASGLQHSSTQMNPAGSVLLGMIGEGRTRGQVAVLDIEACNNQNCAAIWVSLTPVLPEYVYYWLWSRYEATRQGSSGNNQPALNKARVEQIVLPLPPLEEQHQIVAEAEERLSIADQTEVEVRRSCFRATRFRQSILKRAFEGRLVPQDPNDEPASVLLERLRRQKSAT